MPLAYLPTRPLFSVTLPASKTGSGSGESSFVQANCLRQIDHSHWEDSGKEIIDLRGPCILTRNQQANPNRSMASARNLAKRIQSRAEKGLRFDLDTPGKERLSDCLEFTKPRGNGSKSSIKTYLLNRTILYWLGSRFRPIRHRRLPS